MITAIAWDGGWRYLVTDADERTPLTLARIVDLSSGRVSPPIRVGTITAQAEPDEWRFEQGPDAARAVALVS